MLSFYNFDTTISGFNDFLSMHGQIQIDLRGNPYGILAAHPVAPLVSLHHLDYVDPIFPASTQIDALRRLISAYKTDPSRILQHSFCHDQTRNWSVSVSWGYTIQIYPSLVTARELETPFLTFKSWRTSSSEPFTFDTKPISEDSCERPFVYFLDRVYGVGSNQTLTTYRKHVEMSDTQCESPEYSRLNSVEFIDISVAKWMPALWRMVSTNLKFVYIYITYKSVVYNRIIDKKQQSVRYKIAVQHLKTFKNMV